LIIPQAGLQDIDRRRAGPEKKARPRKKPGLRSRKVYFVESAGGVAVGGVAVGGVTGAGALSLGVLGGVAGGAVAGAGKSAAGGWIRAGVLDSRMDDFDRVLLATLFAELFVLVAAGSGELAAMGSFVVALMGSFVVALVVLSLVPATTTGAGGGDSAWLGVDDATLGALSDMAWSYTNAPPITLTTIVPKAIPKWFIFGSSCWSWDWDTGGQRGLRVCDANRTMPTNARP
jgi:hypothetical protein